MPWVEENGTTHNCRKSLPWLAPWLREGMRYRCGKKIDREGVKAPCDRVWEIVTGPAKDGTADMEKTWQPVGGLPQVIADKRREVDAVADRLERERLEAELAAEWLRHVGTPSSKTEVLDTDGELAVIRWTLDELERRGLAKWAHE